MCNDFSFINNTQKTLKPSEKNVSIPRMDEKKLHASEFRLKGISGNMRCKLLQKDLMEKQLSVPNTCNILSLKKIFFQNLTDAFFKYLITILRYSKNTLYTDILQFSFLLQNYVTPPPPPPPRQNYLLPHNNIQNSGGACPCNVMCYSGYVFSRTSLMAKLHFTKSLY